MNLQLFNVPNFAARFSLSDPASVLLLALTLGGSGFVNHCQQSKMIKTWFYRSCRLFGSVGEALAANGIVYSN